MNIEDRLKDINDTGLFNKIEISNINSNNDKLYNIINDFKSDEFHLIKHYTNAEIYYLTEVDLDFLDTCDESYDTDKGRIYCFK